MVKDRLSIFLSIWLKTLKNCWRTQDSQWKLSRGKGHTEREHTRSEPLQSPGAEEPGTRPGWKAAMLWELSAWQRGMESSSLKLVRQSNQQRQTSQKQSWHGDINSDFSEAFVWLIWLSTFHWPEAKKLSRELLQCTEEVLQPLDSHETQTGDPVLEAEAVLQIAVTASPSQDWQEVEMKQKQRPPELQACL